MPCASICERWRWDGRWGWRDGLRSLWGRNAIECEARLRPITGTPELRKTARSATEFPPIPVGGFDGAFEGDPRSSGPTSYGVSSFALGQSRFGGEPDDEAFLRPTRPVFSSGYFFFEVMESGGRHTFQAGIRLGITPPHSPETYDRDEITPAPTVPLPMLYRGDAFSGALGWGSIGPM